MNLIAFFLFGLLHFAIRIVYVFLWAFFGWFIGLFFGDAFLAIAAQLGLENITMWQIGAVFGFLSTFFTAPFKVTWDANKFLQKQQPNQPQNGRYIDPHYGVN